MTYYHPKNLIKINEKGRITLSLAVIFGLIFLSIVYLAQTNELIKNNFQLRAFQKSLNLEKEKNQQLMVLLTQAQSINNLEDIAKNLKLIPIEKIQYLKAISDSFAMSR